MPGICGIANTNMKSTDGKKKSLNNERLAQNCCQLIQNRTAAICSEVQANREAPAFTALRRTGKLKSRHPLWGQRPFSFT